MPCQGRFAGLSRPHQRDDREAGQHRSNDRCCRSWIIWRGALAHMVAIMTGHQTSANRLFLSGFACNQSWQWVTTPDNACQYVPSPLSGLLQARCRSAIPIRTVPARPGRRLPSDRRRRCRGQEARGLGAARPGPGSNQLGRRRSPAKSGTAPCHSLTGGATLSLIGVIGGVTSRSLAMAG